jgi:hypothetical protein
VAAELQIGDVLRRAFIVGVTQKFLILTTGVRVFFLLQVLDLF